jgi:predicted RNA-binding Zn-ribbon protein involved in translation (DUF1610 family)
VTKKKRARSERRALERRQDKLASARRKLIALEPGGSPARPIVVDSAAVVEPRAESFACPECGSSMRAEEHRALSPSEQTGYESLREVGLCCRRCGSSLRLFFRIVEPRPN